MALPGRQIIAVADSSYAVIELLNAVRRWICMITRMRLDARLFDPPARRRPGAVGRPRVRSHGPHPSSWSATSLPNSSRRHSCAPISTQTLSTAISCCLSPGTKDSD